MKACSLHLPASASPPSENYKRRNTLPLNPCETKNQDLTGLELPKMAKRCSKDKFPGSSAALVGGALLLNPPYPFSKPGSGIPYCRMTWCYLLVLLPNRMVKNQRTVQRAPSQGHRSQTTSGGSEGMTGYGSGEDKQRRKMTRVR
jgi:hypothetical protein